MGKVSLQLDYVNSFVDRHGRRRTYFRKGATCIALPNPTDPNFAEEYEALLAEHAPERLLRRTGRGRSARGPLPGTLAAVIAAYKEKAPAWKKAKPSTREIYQRRFTWLEERYGAADLASFDERGVRRIRDKLAEHPSKADATVDIIGRLWRFAKEHLDMYALGPNPTTEVASIHTEHESAPAWPPELCRMFEELHERPQLQRAYFLMRYTGQRRSDVVKMAVRQYDGTAIEVMQEKTGTYVWIPAHRDLRAHLEATGLRGDYLLSTTRGGRYRPTSLTTMICNQCTEFGFKGYSPHGLRHLAGASLAEAGATIEQIMSILGHLTEDEARLYVKQARRKVMAAQGMRLWEGASEQPANGFHKPARFHKP